MNSIKLNIDPQDTSTFPNYIVSIRGQDKIAKFELTGLLQKPDIFINKNGISILFATYTTPTTKKILDFIFEVEAVGKLKVLHFKNCCLEKIWDVFIKKVLSEESFFKCIDFNGCNISNKNLWLFIKKITQYQTKVLMNSNEELNQYKKMNEKITQLSISNQVLDSVQLKTICHLLQNSYLSILRLYSNYIQDGEVSSLLSEVRASHLKILDLSNNSISDKSILYIVQFIKRTPSLENLALAKNKISDVGVKHIANALCAIDQNETPFNLDLSNNQISDDGALHLIVKGKRLKILFLQHNYGIKSYKVPVEAYKSPNITFLAINDTKIFGAPPDCLFADYTRENNNGLELQISFDFFNNGSFAAICSACSAKGIELHRLELIYPVKPFQSELIERILINDKANRLDLVEILSIEDLAARKAILFFYLNKYSYIEEIEEPDSLFNAIVKGIELHEAIPGQFLNKKSEYFISDQLPVVVENFTKSKTEKLRFKLANFILANANRLIAEASKISYDPTPELSLEGLIWHAQSLKYAINMNRDIDIICLYKMFENDKSQSFTLRIIDINQMNSPLNKREDIKNIFSFPASNQKNILLLRLGDQFHLLTKQI